MSDFFKSASGSTPKPDMAAQKEAFMKQIRNEYALNNAQELMNKMNEKCFLKCITKPSTSLSNSEETCLTRCMQRYMDAFNIVSRVYVSRLSRERDQQLAQGGLPSPSL